MSISSPNVTDLKKSSSVDTAKTSNFIRRLSPITLRRTSEGWQVQIHWGRLCITAFVASVLGWLSLTSAAYLFVKYQRGFTDVRFADMLIWPIRPQNYRVSRGDFLIASAQDQLRDEKYGAAFQSLRVGVSKSPSNKEGRLLLAQFYGAWKRPDLAQQTLLDGVAYQRNDTDYLKVLFTFLLQRQEDARTLTIAKDLLGADRTLSTRNQLIAMAAASASFFRGNYDQAEDYMHTFALETTRDGRLLAARIAWERGLKDIALTQLRQLASEFPDDAEIYNQSVTFLRDAGLDGEARRVSFLRSITNPGDARARIDLLYALQKEGDTTAVKNDVQEIFQDFLRKPASLLALGDFAANTGDPALAKRIYDYAVSHRLNREGAALMLVESNIVAKKYQAALELVRQLLSQNPDWSKRYYTVFNGLQAIAHYGLGDAESAQLFLNNFLTQDNVRADNLVAVSKRLMEVGAQTQARQVLAKAVAADPLNQPALTSLIKIDLELNNTDNLADNVRKLLDMRKPPRDLLISAYRKLGSDLFLFAPGRITLLEELRKTIAANPANS
ncbi:MAG TPA: hypothetical protein VL357_04775 [Rariglobus sp.]|jgi:Tfp pilus assembly protein PilF|nr:hypothetical protein [Rariglobus sp.]